MLALRIRRAVAVAATVQLLGTAFVAAVAIFGNKVPDLWLWLCFGQMVAGMFLYTPALILWTIYRLARWAQLIPARWA